MSYPPPEDYEIESVRALYPSGRLNVEQATRGIISGGRYVGHERIDSWQFTLYDNGLVACTPWTRRRGQAFRRLLADLYRRRIRENHK